MLAAVAGGLRASAATSACPAPGSTVGGGLEGTGYCVLDHVTVTGGGVVESGGHLELDDSTVSGGVTGQSGGALAAGHGFISTATYDPSTINGGVTIANAYDDDLDGATVHGGVRIINPPAAPTICGSTIDGGLSISGPVGFEAWVGDPDTSESLFAFGVECAGNTIHGDVTVTNSRPVAFEADTVRWHPHRGRQRAEDACEHHPRQSDLRERHGAAGSLRSAHVDQHRDRQEHLLLIRVS